MINSNRFKIVLVPLLLLVFAVGCKVTLPPCQESRVKLKQREGKIQMSAKLKSFLKSNPSPRVMLRTPQGNNNTTKAEQFRGSDLYYLIEQELIANGFQVVDRALAENKIEAKVDLIIDIVDYLTVSYFVKSANRSAEFDTKEEYNLNQDIELTGGVLYSKIILVDDSSVEGTFELHYTPCVDGCIVSHRPLYICHIEDIKKGRRKKAKYTTSINGASGGNRISLVSQIITELTKYRPTSK
jgi:hypothetical protein